MDAGYSTRSLVDKLGIKENASVVLLHSPQNYTKTLGRLPQGATIRHELNEPSLFIQYFTKSKLQLSEDFPNLKKLLLPTGMLWISWPKLSSSIKTDLNENIIRDIGLHNGLVDVKVIAIDADWSGLKFVFRLKDRK